MVTFIYRLLETKKRAKEAREKHNLAAPAVVKKKGGLKEKIFGMKKPSMKH